MKKIRQIYTLPKFLSMLEEKHCGIYRHNSHNLLTSKISLNSGKQLKVNFSIFVSIKYTPIKAKCILILPKCNARFIGQIFTIYGPEAKKFKW